MGTIADLILNVVQFVTGERAGLKKAKRDEVDRIADYLQRISDGLRDAATKFATERHPWGETREMAHHVRRLLFVLGDSLKDDSFANELKDELTRAVNADYGLLTGSRERTVVDAITLRPPGHEYGAFAENPVRQYSEERLSAILADEVRKLEEAAGLFRAAADELRARAT